VALFSKKTDPERELSDLRTRKAAIERQLTAAESKLAEAPRHNRGCCSKTISISRGMIRVGAWCPG
jgi:hypothetical protein